MDVDIDNIVGIRGDGKVVVGVYCWREIFLKVANLLVYGVGYVCAI